MTDATTVVHSRRSLLAALTGGLAAYAATALGRPQRAAAGTIYVELGGTNPSTSTTTIDNQDPDETALSVSAQGPGTAVFATSPGGYAVYGDSGTGRGIGASSDASHGLYAQSFSASHAAMVGSARGEAAGVQGHSGPGLPPGAPVKTGVYGRAVQDGTSNGVFGASAIGTGVRGTAEDGSGVRGFAQTGIGVYAEAGSHGIALRTIGRLEPDTSGRASVAVGRRVVIVNVPYDLDGASRILCTLESDQNGLFIHRLMKDVETTSFRVVLSAVVATGRTATVSWLVLG